MIFTCGLCGGTTDDLMHHLRLFHPEKYEQLDDGSSAGDDG